MIRLAHPGDAAAVPAIYAPIVRDTAISFEWEVPSVEEMGRRITLTYVRADARAQGLGRRLYAAHFAVLRLQGFCSAVAGATVPNAGAERLHERRGFRPIGRFPNAGYNFDRWHDVAFWYLPLRPLPAQPHDLLPISQVLGTQEWNDAIQA